MPLKLRTSVNGRRPRAPIVRGRWAFTILEILLVITLIGMLTGVLVTGSVHLLREKPVTPEDVFWKAVSETRKRALLGGTDVYLRYEAKEKDRALMARGLDGTEQRFPFEGEGEIALDFLSTQKGMSSILIHGQLVETQTVPFVTFFGDGTCSPFRLQLRSFGVVRTLAIDPWTCAPVLTPAETTR